MTDQEFLNKVCAVKATLMKLGSKFNQKVIKALLEYPDGLYVSQIVEKLDTLQSTVSSCLISLNKLGILNSEKQGKRVLYTINREVFEKYKWFVNELTNNDL